ncbi:uncharacterized protein [Physcomitrium patens]|uniref:uncharacterized protein n=1 Tax=Physcomitrium patens TaxID=3218 RepID=UPI003CCD3AF8
MPRSIRAYSSCSYVRAVFQNIAAEESIREVSRLSPIWVLVPVQRRYYALPLQTDSSKLVLGSCKCDDDSLPPSTSLQWLRNNRGRVEEVQIDSTTTAASHAATLMRPSAECTYGVHSLRDNNPSQAKKVSHFRLSIRPSKAEDQLRSYKFSQQHEA